jgi:hypothetical protein
MTHSTRKSLRFVDQHRLSHRDRRTGLILGQIGIAGLTKLTRQFQHPSRFAPSTSTEELNGVAWFGNKVDNRFNIDNRNFDSLKARQFAKRITIEITFRPMVLRPIFRRRSGLTGRTGPTSRTGQRDSHVRYHPMGLSLVTLK